MMSTPPTRMSSPPPEIRPRLEVPRMIHHCTSRTADLTIPARVHAIMPSIPRFRVHGHILSAHSLRSTRCLSVAQRSLLTFLGRPVVWRKSAFDALRCLCRNRLVLNLHLHCLLRYFCCCFRYWRSDSRTRHNGLRSGE